MMATRSVNSWKVGLVLLVAAVVLAAILVYRSRPEPLKVVLFASQSVKHPDACKGDAIFNGDTCVPAPARWSQCERLPDAKERGLCQDFASARVAIFRVLAHSKAKDQALVRKKFAELGNADEQGARLAKALAGIPRIFCKVRTSGKVTCLASTAMLAAATDKAAASYLSDTKLILGAYNIGTRVDRIFKCPSGVWTWLDTQEPAATMTAGAVVKAILKCSQLDRIAGAKGKLGENLGGEAPALPALITNIGMNSHCVLQDVSLTQSSSSEFTKAALDYASQCRQPATQAPGSPSPNPMQGMMEGQQSSTQNGPADDATVTSSETTTSTDDQGNTVVTTKETFSDGTEVVASTNTGTDTTRVDVKFPDGSSRTQDIDAGGNNRKTGVRDSNGNGYDDHYNADGTPHSRVYTSGAESVYGKNPTTSQWEEQILLMPDGRIYLTNDTAGGGWDFNSEVYRECSQLDESCSTCSAAGDALRKAVKACAETPAGMSCASYKSAMGCCKQKTPASGSLIIPDPEGEYVCVSGDKSFADEACKRQCSIAGSTDTNCQSKCSAGKRAQPFEFDLLDRICNYAISDMCTGGAVHVTTKPGAPSGGTNPPVPIHMRTEDLWMSTN